LPTVALAMRLAVPVCQPSKKMVKLTEQLSYFSEIQDAKEQLDYARLTGDKLKIDLREAALNDLLDRYSNDTVVTVVTSHK